MEIHFEIVDQCLLNCRHCSSLASDIGGKMKYSEQNMISFLSSINEKKEIFLTGGEPLLYPDLENLLDNLQMQVCDAELGLFTTGIIKDAEGAKPISGEYAKKLANCGLKVCYLSIYSHEAKEHDWMTRLEGSFQILNKSIKHLQSAGIEIRINSVVTAKNAFCFDKLIGFAESAGVTEVRILKLIRHGRACSFWKELGVTEEQYRMVIRNAIKRESKLRITASGAIDILPCRYLYNTDTCPAGKHLLYITNEGDVFPCASVKRTEEYKIGNVKDVDINKKWYLFQKEMTGKVLCK